MSDSKFKINLILAVDLNYALGKDNDLPYTFPKDWKRFVSLTKEKTVVMGRKTWDSLPVKLPKRKNCVVTTASKIEPSLKKGKMVEPDLVLNSIDEVLELAKSEDIWVIGGGNIYKQMFEHADTIELTHIMADHVEYDTDVKWLEQDLIDSDFNVTNIESVMDTDRISGKDYKIKFITYSL